MATTVNDKVMYVVLVRAIVAGLYATALGSGVVGEAYNRLVHAFSAPIGYLFRPYIVYRSREVAAKNELVGSHPRRRGW